MKLNSYIFAQFVFLQYVCMYVCVCDTLTLERDGDLPWLSTAEVGSLDETKEAGKGLS